MSDSFDSTKNVISHDIHCLSNEIKDLLPKLITRIEYNKVISSSTVNSSKEKLENVKSQTTTFLKGFELFVNIP